MVKFCTLAPNISESSSVWNWFCVTLLALRILRWLVDFWKVCALLLSCVCHYQQYKILKLLQRTRNSGLSAVLSGNVCYCHHYRMYLDLHVKCWYICLILTKLEFSWQFLLKVYNIISQISFHWEQNSFMQMDR